MKTATRTTAPARVRVRRLFIVGLTGIAFTMVAASLVSAVATPRRTTPVYDPPVLAGQTVPGYCSAGFYARRGETIVLTTSNHCAGEGTTARDPSTGVILGVVGPQAESPTCAYPGYKCASSDMNYLVVATDRIPWGHLNVVDFGTAGYRVISPGTKALGCDDIAIGDEVEVDGRAVYRKGVVTDKGANHAPIAQDGSYFPCMVLTDVPVFGGDSGGSVLVRGIPAGVSSRNFGGTLGFTPLAGGLTELGLDLCTTPDCGLTPPTASR